jgi:hypothetical protein
MSKTYNSLRTYFQDKIKSKEPSLFLTSKTPGKDKSEVYSRNCQSSQKRQPVILTLDEYQKIVDKYPEYSSPDKHIIYGTGNTKYYYICPRYWNVPEERSVSQKEIDDKKLQAHIVTKEEDYNPSNKEKYIIDLTSPLEHFKTGKYTPYLPGFLKTLKTKSGKCLPCCFTGVKDKDSDN